MAKQILIDTNSFDDYVNDVLVAQRDILCKQDLDFAMVVMIAFYTTGALAHLRELIYGEEE